MNIYKARNKEGAMRRAIKRLNSCLRSAKKNPVLLMVSGGSALELLDGIEMRNIGKYVTLSVLDERYSTDPAVNPVRNHARAWRAPERPLGRAASNGVNNFSQIVETEFYKKAERKGIDYIDTRIHDKITLKGLTMKFERGLRKWRKRYPKGKVIITQGIGHDGHTAGIVPYPENPQLFKKLFDDPTKWVVGYDAGNKNLYPLRVTVTLPFLRDEVDHSIVYATGRDKKEAFRRVLAKEGTLWQTPARIIHEIEEVKLFTDQK